MKGRKKIMKNENAKQFSVKDLIDKMYVDKDANPKVVKPVVGWSILGGEFVLAGLIALIVFLCI